VTKQSKVSESTDDGLLTWSWSLEFGVWSLEFGVWSLEFGVWSLELELEFGVWSLEFVTKTSNLHGDISLLHNYVPVPLERIIQLIFGVKLKIKVKKIRNYCP